MDEPRQDHGRQPPGQQNNTTSTMQPTWNEMNNPFFQDLLRYRIPGPTLTTHMGEQRRGLPVPPTEPHRENHAVNDTAKHDAGKLVSNGAGGTTSWKEIKRTKQLVGQALEDRRRLARDRILRGGWAAHVAEAAINLTMRMAWKDHTSSMTCVQRLIHTFVDLGEHCDDLGAIRAFLDANIHKLVAYRAMERDFQVPYPIARRAEQMAGDGTFKYDWFRLVLQELQGLESGAVAIWLRPYRADGGEATEGGFDNGSSAQVEQSGGRKRSGDELDEELDVAIPTTRVKLEPAEDVPADLDTLPQSRSNSHYARAPSPEVVYSNGGEDGRQAGRRTLTVLFDGMRMDGAEESEHVQVYVPRTAKGVTINFL